MIHNMKAAKIIHDDFRYGPEEHGFFEREGYFIFDRFLTDEAAAEARSHADRMYSELAEGMGATEMMSPHQLGEKWMWDIASDPKVLDYAQRRLGPNLLLWHADLLIKEPRTGRHIPWHQDQVYWDAQKVFAPVANVWIAFDDVDENNGAMSVLPREHTHGLQPHTDMGDFFGLAIDAQVLPPDAEDREVQYRFKAGQAATHSSHAPHRSTPNSSASWRRVMTMHFMRAEADGMAPRHYTSYQDKSTFDREFYLVRGEDPHNRGLKRNPYESDE